MEDHINMKPNDMSIILELAARTRWAFWIMVTDRRVLRFQSSPTSSIFIGHEYNQIAPINLYSNLKENITHQHSKRFGFIGETQINRWCRIVKILFINHSRK